MADLKKGSLIGLGVAVGAGVVGVGVTAGVLAHRTLVARGPADRLPPPPELPATVTTRSVEVSDGAHLTVLDSGPGRPGHLPVVLLHGVTLAAAIWHHQLVDLAAAGHRVVAWDLRGHGTSDARSLELDRMVADIDDVADALGLDRFVLVGHSMGGMVAIKAVADDPVTAAGRGRIAALGLVATSASPVTGSGIPGARVAARALQPLLGRTAWLTARLPGASLPQSDFAYVAARAHFGADPDPAEVALTQRVVTGVRASTTGALLVEILRFDDLAALAGVHLPATVVVGTRDLATPVRHAQALADAIGGAVLVVLEGCGHMVMLERPAELAAAIEDLAARAGDAPAGEAPDGGTERVEVPAPQ